MSMVILVPFLFQNFQVVVQFFSIKLIESLHLLVTFLQTLNIILHLDLSTCVQLHTLYSQFLNFLIKVFFSLLSISGKISFHCNMLIETLIYLLTWVFDISFSLKLHMKNTSALNLLWISSSSFKHWSRSALYCFLILSTSCSIS